MALPSQSGRPVTTSSGGRNRRRTGFPLPAATIAGTVFIGACLIGWWWLTREPERIGPATVGDGGQEQGRVASNDTNPNGRSVEPTNRNNDSTPEVKPVGTPEQTKPTIIIEYPEQPATGGPSNSNEGTRPTGGGSDVDRLIEKAQQAASKNDYLAARSLFHDVLRHPRATDLDRDLARESITLVNQELVFSPKVYPEDPLTGRHTVQNGENLTTIVRSLGLAVERTFIARINNMKNPDIVGLGQRLKIFHGPMHAVVEKSAFRLDIYAGDPDMEQSWTYIRSFPIGLGEGNSTPVGEFRVMRNSKVVNPSWRNPITGKVYDSTDPANPIGEHWIGLQGMGDAEVYAGYGIHGTVEPESIGKMMSMGCVRMRDEDVAMVYEMLVPEASRVSVRP